MSEKHKMITQDEELLFIPDETTKIKKKGVIKILVITIASILIILTLFFLISVFLAKPYDNTWLSNFLLPKSDNSIETELEKLKGYYFIGFMLTIAVVLLVFSSILIKKSKNKK